MNMKNSVNQLVVILALLVLGLGCIDLRGTLPENDSTPPPPPTPQQQQVVETETSDDSDETAELKKKIEELEKKIDDQGKRRVSTKRPVVKTDPKPRDPKANAQVNSPNDGYLAMRSLPDTVRGYRVMKIPHGADVRVLSCQSYSSRISGRRGTWCRVRYAGRTGWAFDAWLAYY